MIPSLSLTRSDLAVMLHTAQESPVANYAMDFEDVAQDAPYAEAVRWAASQRLMSGYGDGSFGPEDPVTREQLAVGGHLPLCPAGAGLGPSEGPGAR